MRICFLCNEYPPGRHGGIGTFTQVLARALVQAGNEVRVAGVYSPSYSAPNYEEDQGVRVWRLRQPPYRLSWLVARWRLCRMLAGWARKSEIDLIEAPDWQGGVAGWPRLPTPVVCRVHGSATYFAAELGEAVNRTTYWLERAALRRVDSWCSVSRYAAEKTRALFQLPSNPRAILYNPIEPAPTLAAARSRNRVVFTGTLTAKKGVVPLIRAWPQVSGACRDAELHIYGKDGLGPDGQSMQSYLQSLLQGVSGAVYFHGHVPRAEVLQALQLARVAVFPSYAEAFAIAPLEAMTAGCPTIYSQRGSGPELIHHGRNGLLIDPDQPQEIAQSIIRVLTDDHLASALGDAARKRVFDSFSLSTLVKANLAFYEACLRDFERCTGRPDPSESDFQPASPQVGFTPRNGRKRSDEAVPAQPTVHLQIPGNVP